MRQTLKKNLPPVPNPAPAARTLSAGLSGTPGITGGQANTARFSALESHHASLPEAASLRRDMTRPFSSHASRSSISSLDELLGKRADEGEPRTNLRILSQEEFAFFQERQKKNDRELVFVGYHGTARWVLESIKIFGVDTGLTGKYRGGKSGGGTGLYVAKSANPDDHAQSDGMKVAQHYARRACLGEQDGFDKDLRPVVIALYRLPAPDLKRAEMPAAILGDMEKVKKFREKKPAHEYDLGETPVPRRLEGVKAHTTLISDAGLNEIEYVGVVIPQEREKNR